MEKSLHIEECNKIMATNDIIKELRKKNNLTQAQLGEILSCDRTRIVDIERGKSEPKLDDIILLSKKFNVSTDYLLCIDPEPTNDKDMQFVCKYLNLTKETVERLRFYMKDTPIDVLPYWDLFYEFKEGKFVELEWHKTLSNISFKEFYIKSLDSFLFSQNFDKLIKAMALALFYDYFISSICIADDKIIEEISINNSENISKLISFKDNYKRFSQYEIIDALNSVTSYANFYNPLNHIDKDNETAINKRLDEIVEKIKKSRNK